VVPKLLSCGPQIAELGELNLYSWGGHPPPLSPSRRGALLGAVPSACPGMEHMLEKRLLRGCPSPLPEPTTIKWEDIGSIKQVRALGGQSQYHCPPSACSNARGADQISSGRSWA
jgi:hypothetical protein